MKEQQVQSNHNYFIVAISSSFIAETVISSKFAAISCMEVACTLDIFATVPISCTIVLIYLNISVIKKLIVFDDSSLIFASLPISFATNENPLLDNPTLAASIDAFSANRFDLYAFF